MIEPTPPRHFTHLNLIGVQTLIEREMHRAFRFFGFAVLGPALQAALFAGIILITLGDNIPQTVGLSYMTFLATGFIATSMFQRAYESTAYSFMFDKMEGNIDDLIGAPVIGIEILTGYVVSALVISLAIGLSVWGTLLLLDGPVLPINPVELCASIILGCALFSSIGLLSSIFSEKWDKLSAKHTFMVMPLMFLSGSFFPRSAVDQDLHFLLDLNPVFRLVEGVRYGFTGAHELDIWAGLWMAASWTVVIWAVTLVVLTTGYRIKP